jgi:hypothetical protein
MEQGALWTATKEKYRGQLEFVKNMRVRQKRNIFFILRQCQDISPDTFLPCYGLHCGEFACFQILAEHSRKDARGDAPSSLASTGPVSKTTGDASEAFRLDPGALAPSEKHGASIREHVDGERPTGYADLSPASHPRSAY